MSSFGGWVIFWERRERERDGHLGGGGGGEGKIDHLQILDLGRLASLGLVLISSDISEL